MKNIQKITNSNLRPWLANINSSDEYYRQELNALTTVQPAFNPHYELNFMSPFSSKTQYYKKLINNDLTEYCNTLFQETENASNNLIAYKIDKSKKGLHDRIIAIGTIINTQNFELSHITSPMADFSIDRQYKESTYIMFYLLSAIIRCCLEIQHHFRANIAEDDIMEIADFYTRILQKQAPNNLYIKEIQIIEIEVAHDNKKKKRDTENVLAFTYKKLQREAGNISNLFNSLKTHNRIAQNTSITDFKRAFSGVAVDNPIRWTGAKSELPYLIKLLCHTHKVLEYTGSLWQIVCACFLDKDGNTYDETNLKDQKKPKKTAAAIEKSAELMK